MQPRSGGALTEQRRRLDHGGAVRGVGNVDVRRRENDEASAIVFIWDVARPIGEHVNTNEGAAFAGAK